VLSTIAATTATLVSSAVGAAVIVKTLNVITLASIVIGGINWLLPGLFQFDLVGALFGGPQATLTRLIYVIVGVSALWQIVPWARALSLNEALAEQARPL
jgi:uncharacterized membrane protein YuzA (DUF378 family)